MKSTIGIHESPPSQTTPPNPTPSGLHRAGPGFPASYNKFSLAI